MPKFMFDGDTATEGTIVHVEFVDRSTLALVKKTNLVLIDPSGKKIKIPITTVIEKPAGIFAVPLDTTNFRSGRYSIGREDDSGIPPGAGKDVEILVTPRPLAHGDTIPVTMRRSALGLSPDLPLWVVIKGSSQALQFSNYMKHMDLVLCGAKKSEMDDETSPTLNEYARLSPRRALPFTDSEAYRLLKVATEAFVVTNCGVVLDKYMFDDDDTAELLKRVDTNLSPTELGNLWESYLVQAQGSGDSVIPYFEAIKRKFPEMAEGDMKENTFVDAPDGVDKVNSWFLSDNLDSEKKKRCYGLLKRKIQQPCLIELIWSYWHEEGMLVQTMAAITQRFQNKRSPSTQDPLANLEIDPLRPLNNVLWGYVQDEIHRLSVVRRAYEYDHHYGLRLFGKALPDFRPADTRSKFLEAFHNLLNLCSKFYKQDDDTTVVADGFPVLNALRDVHLLLSEGAHNQFGDLPGTARVEMLMQQWMLARPEFREFLPTRIMVAYPEPWMDRVDGMKKLQGWTDVNVLHFRNLALFGEQVLLSIRYGAWADAYDPKQAANWARFWRSEIQGYIHAYRAVAGVDLTADKVDSVLPAVHLQNRLMSQMRIPEARAAIASSRTRVG